MTFASISRLRNSVLFAGTVVVLLIVLGGISARAQSGGQAVTGWAWSSNIGWISMDGAGYGVSENPGTGALSGYAWSSNIGWITFEKDKLSGCPTAPCRAMVDLSTGNLIGWARACAAFSAFDAFGNATDCSGALDDNSGGWDGWIALSGTATDGTVYGVTQSNTTGAWSGFAWGSDAIGAISFGGPNSSVFGICNGPCTTATLPQAFLSASPLIIVPGQSSTLTWSSTNATSCVGTGFTAGARSGSRNTVVFNTPGNYSYQVVCRDGGGIDSPPAFATVTVLSPANLTISANPVRVRSGSTSIISASATGVQSCAVSGPTGIIASSTVADANNNYSMGSPRIVTIARQSTFTITCQAGGFPVARSVVVNLLPSFNEF